MLDRLLNLWHDLYYKFTGIWGDKFALTCKEATEQVNVAAPGNFVLWFRVRLHISLCQACRFYARVSRALGQALQKLMQESEEVDLEGMNRDLLKKYSRESSHNTF